MYMATYICYVTCIIYMLTCNSCATCYITYVIYMLMCKRLCKTTGDRHIYIYIYDRHICMYIKDDDKQYAKICM